MTPYETQIVKFLRGREDWISPTEMGIGIWNRCESSRASRICKKLVAKGILVRHPKGWYKLAQEITNGYKHYLIQDDDGVLTVRRAEHTSGDYWEAFGTVQPEEMPPALAIGMKVVDELEKHPGRKLDTIDRAVASRGHHIAVYTVKSPPAPLVGLAWLKSLPVGTRIRHIDGQGSPMIVVEEGLLFGKCFWHWDGRSRYRADGTLTKHCWWHDEHPEISQEACPETCPEWTPGAMKENTDKTGPTCLDIANGLGHDQAKKMGIPLTDKLTIKEWKRQRQGNNDETA